ncbi:MAG: O-antigen ligase protein [Solirubrobacterales bacterium]|nr:O-antigen ligase protein [Solirubrobacterales bacterium]
MATVAATLAAFRPSVSPPALTARLSAPAIAKGQLLVDRPVSVLTSDEADASATSSLALTYTQYLRTEQARVAIAEAAGVPPMSVQVDGPFTTLLGRENVIVRPPIEPPEVARPHRLLLDVTPNRPVVTVIASAPERGLSVALVDGALAFLREQVAAARRTAAPDDGEAATLRSLGPTVSQGSRPPPTAALFVLVFVGVLALAGTAAARSVRPRTSPRRTPLSTPVRGDDWPHTARPLPWALAAFTAMIWLVPFAAVGIPGKLDRLALVALALVWAATLLAPSPDDRPGGRPWFTGIHAAAVALFVVCATGVVLNAGTLANLGELKPAVKQVAVLASMLAFLVIAGSALRPAEVPRFVSLMLAFAALVAAGTLVEARSGTNVFYAVTSVLTGGRAPMPPEQADSIGRVTIYGPTVHPLELAAMLAMALPFAAVRMLDAPDRRSHVFHLALCGLLIAGALSTERKTSVLAPAAGLLVVAAYRPRQVGRQLLPLVVGVGVLVHLLAPGTVGSVFSQLEPGNATSTLSTRDRASDYTGVAPDVVRHLVVGRGYGSYDPAKYRILDNQYLGLAVQAGMLGLVAYLTLFGTAFALMHRLATARDRLRGPPALGAGAAVAVVAMASALFDVLSFPHVVYLLFLVCGLLATLDAPDGAGDHPPVRPRVVRPQDVAGEPEAAGDDRAALTRVI